MNTILDAAVRSATPQEAREAIPLLRRVIAREYASSGGEPRECPRCGCGAAVRRGHDRKGRQVWLCRGCGRTFTSATGGLLSGSKLDEGRWMDFCDCAADMLDLRTTAQRVGVSLPTAWFMRMRLFEAVGRGLDPFESGPGVAVQLDGTYAADNMSGDHAVAARAHGAPQAFEMPRPARRHGGAGHTRGVSGELVCVACGANDRGGCFCELVSRGRPADAAVKGALEGRLAPGTVRDTDGHSAYARVLPGLACECRAHDHDADPGSLAMVDGLHSRLKAYLARFRGVSTRRLQRYLDFFCWAEQTRAPGSDLRASAMRDASRGRYSRTRRATFAEPRLFQDRLPASWAG